MPLPAWADAGAVAPIASAIASRSERLPIEGTLFPGHVSKQCRWTESFTVPVGQLVALAFEPVCSDQVDIRRDAAIKRTESPAQDRADVGVLRPGYDSLPETAK